MSELPVTEKPPLWRRPWAQGAAIFVLVFIGMLYYEFVPAFTDDGLRSTSIGLSGTDGYYHIKMAWLYRTGEVAEAGANFHWTRESTWSNAFSDKDFLFHIYLVPFTIFADGPGDAAGLILAGKLGISVLSALMVLTLFVVLRGFGVRYAWLFALGVVAVGGSYFVFRMNLCRSFVASIIFALTGWLLMARGQRKALFLVAALYTLTYTASHLLLAMLLVRATMELFMGARPGSTRLRDLRNNGILGACIVGGIAVGCALHPQSAELVKLWWTQNVVVLALSHKGNVAAVVDGLGAAFGYNTDYGAGVEIALGRELQATQGPAAVFATPLIFFSPMLLPLMAAILGWRPTREAVLTATIAVVFLVLYLVNTRFIEYAAPFMTLALGVWVTGLLGCDGFAGWVRRRPVIGRALPISGAIIAMIACFATWVGAARAYVVRDRGDIEMAGRWLHETREAHGKVVWHDRWDHFTELLFYASECDYLIGLDPTFMVVHDRAKYETWYEIQRGKRRDFVHTIRDDFNADYILANRSSSEFFYNRLYEEARAGKLTLCIRADDDSWALYRINR